ncbi:unnamed protein product [Acanthoscelides obtectus]|uniref:Uncharacterized protein n=1 Tax=Acanthoscelides obtectus TaxID=200917 RepID=A0A9P0MDQ0_ACAOB|nr:unnamed protein product [Acanthoscelides obtectus]CAK1680398.1 hypothetical protein AOBTE_LOCUS32620 [Acanthoscelides obtectus]
MSSITPQPSTSKHADELKFSQSSEEAGHIRKNKKIVKSYTQKYTAAWEQEPEFKGWPRSSKKGKACNKDIICGKSEIQNHSSGKQHTKLISATIKNGIQAQNNNKGITNVLTTTNRTRAIHFQQ